MAPVYGSVKSITLRVDVFLRIGMFLFAFSVDSRHECCIILQFVRGITSISRAVTCVTMETLRNVTNHRGHALNKQSGCQRTCPTCGSSRTQSTRVLSSLNSTDTDWLAFNYYRNIHSQPNQPRYLILLMTSTSLAMVWLELGLLH